MPHHTHEYYDDDHDELEAVEGYCLRCRESVEILDPLPVWTRKGQPATRGECPICGGVVFRMGKTDHHSSSKRPQAVRLSGEPETRKRAKLHRDTVYVNYAPPDEEAAQQIAADLEKSGLAVWLHDPGEGIDWASGVHPALKECARMVYILSPWALVDATVISAWEYFRSERKRIVVAQLEAAEAPDALRRSPRYDLRSEYKAGLRQMLGVLST